MTSKKLASTNFDNNAQHAFIRHASPRSVATAVGEDDAARLGTLFQMFASKFGRIVTTSSPLK
jgi:hypothetical protein